MLLWSSKCLSLNGIDLDNLGAQYSDSFIHLRPEVHRVIDRTLYNPISATEMWERFESMMWLRQCM